MPWRGPIRGNDLPVDALNLVARALFRSPLSSFEFTNLFSRGPLPVGQMRQQILADHSSGTPTALICASLSESNREINSSKIRSSSPSSIDPCIIERLRVPAMVDPRRVR